MTSPFHSAIAGAMEAQKAFAGESVEYRRGSSQEAASAVLTAIHSQREYIAESGYDAVQSVQVDDWLVVAADLALNGSAVAPQRGDRILRTAGAVVQVYEVQFMPGKNVLEWSGPLRYRIHTKLVGTEAAQ